MVNKKTGSGSKVAAGLGVAALAAAAAATYYFKGPEAKKHQTKAKAWVKKARSEMQKKVKTMQDVSEQAFARASQEILAKYRQAKNIKPEELAAFGKELKSAWDKISKSALSLGDKKIKTKK